MKAPRRHHPLPPHDEDDLTGCPEQEFEAGDQPSATTLPPGGPTPPPIPDTLES